MLDDMTKRDELRIAVEAMCDPRTVASYVAGRSVRGLTAERIELAAKKLKIKLPRRPK